MTHLPTTDNNRPFCCLSSSGAESNLQLYFMKKAYQAWEDLEDQTLDERRELEELVFIVVCSGTSICQLLGQNTSHFKPNWIDGPTVLFDRVFGAKHRDSRKFRKFIEIYDACRHFGPPKHPVVCRLDRDSCKDYLHLVIGLWDELIRRYIGDEGKEDFEGYTTIVSAIQYQS